MLIPKLTNEVILLPKLFNVIFQTFHRDPKDFFVIQKHFTVIDVGAFFSSLFHHSFSFTTSKTYLFFSKLAERTC